MEFIEMEFKVGDKDKLVKQIYEHEILHDFITHMYDFRAAIGFTKDIINKIMNDPENENYQYWDKQEQVITNLIEYVEKNIYE